MIMPERKLTRHKICLQAGREYCRMHLLGKVGGRHDRPLLRLVMAEGTAELLLLLCEDLLLPHPGLERAAENKSELGSCSLGHYVILWTRLGSFITESGKKAPFGYHAFCMLRLQRNKQLLCMSYIKLPNSLLTLLSRPIASLPVDGRPVRPEGVTSAAPFSKQLILLLYFAHQY